MVVVKRTGHQVGNRLAEIVKAMVVQSRNNSYRQSCSIYKPEQSQVLQVPEQLRENKIEYQGKGQPDQNPLQGNNGHFTEKHGDKKPYNIQDDQDRKRMAYYPAARQTGLQ